MKYVNSCRVGAGCNAAPWCWGPSGGDKYDLSSELRNRGSRSSPTAVPSRRRLHGVHDERWTDSRNEKGTCKLVSHAQTSVACALFHYPNRKGIARSDASGSASRSRGPAEAVQVPAHCGAPSPLQSTPTDCACRRLAGLLLLDLSRGLCRLAQACLTAPPFHSSSCVERSGAQKAGTPTRFPLASCGSLRVDTFLPTLITWNTLP